MYVYKNCRLCNRPLRWQLDFEDGICSDFNASTEESCYNIVREKRRTDGASAKIMKEESVFPRNIALYQALWDEYLEQNFTTENLKYDHTGIKYTGSEVFGVEQKDSETVR